MNKVLAFMSLAGLFTGLLCAQASAESKPAPVRIPAPTLNQPHAPVQPHFKNPQKAVPKPPQAIPSQGRFGSSTWNQVEPVPAGTTRFGSPPLAPPNKGQNP